MTFYKGSPKGYTFWESQIWLKITTDCEICKSMRSGNKVSAGTCRCRCKSMRNFNLSPLLWLFLVHSSRSGRLGSDVSRKAYGVWDRGVARIFQTGVTFFHTQDTNWSSAVFLLKLSIFRMSSECGVEDGGGGGGGGGQAYKIIAA